MVVLPMLVEHGHFSQLLDMPNILALLELFVESDSCIVVNCVLGKQVLVPREIRSIVEDIKLRLSSNHHILLLRFRENPMDLQIGWHAMY
ncbi:hypothetical protein SLA2020_070940 [Shorea laevis]